MKLKWVIAAVVAVILIMAFSNPSKERCRDEFKNEVQSRLFKDTYNTLKKDAAADSNLIQLDTTTARHNDITISNEAASDEWQRSVDIKSYFLFSSIEYLQPEINNDTSTNSLFKTYKVTRKTLGIGFFNNFIHL